MRKSKDEIVNELKNSFNSLVEVSAAVDDRFYNVSKNNKWTPAENIAHLVNATRMTSLAFTLPKFMHVLLYGKPGRTSHGYGKVVDNYQKKLEGGAVATGVYVPKKTNYTKTDLHNKLQKESSKLINALDNKWSDEQLDHYQVSHPILGLLTVRELAYFTLYHNQHHKNTIEKHYLQGKHEASS
jgi:hypothetical protein